MAIYKLYTHDYVASESDNYSRCVRRTGYKPGELVYRLQKAQFNKIEILKQRILPIRGIESKSALNISRTKRFKAIM